MSVVGIIARLSTAVADGGYTVTRATNAGYDGATGDALPGVTTTFSLDAVIVPYAGHMVVGVEGRHTDDTIEILTTTALNTVSTTQQADRVAYLGQTYEVMRVDGPIHLRGGTHYEALAVRLVQP